MGVSFCIVGWHDWTGAGDICLTAKPYPPLFAEVRECVRCGKREYFNEWRVNARAKWLQLPKGAE